MRPALALTVLFAAAAACGDAPAPDVGPEAPAPGPVLFREVAAERGIDFVHQVTADGRYRIAEVVGSGCAALDANGDGLLDLLFANAGEDVARGAPNRLYLQQPDGRFRDATEESGLGGTDFATGLAVADVDNDGDPDVYVGTWGEDALYVNEGGRFVRHSTDIGLGLPPDGLTTSVAFLDFDLDGFLDVYVARYVVTVPMSSCDGGRTPIADYCVPAAYPPAPDSLYRNRGDGTFEDVTERAGVARVPLPGLAVTAEDLDGDGRIDLYVGNDGRANHAWINAGDGTFRDAALEMGIAYNGMCAAEASMGVAVGDIDGDGQRDILLSHLRGETNTLYRRRGAAGYDDGSGRSGIGGASVPHTGWGVALFDVELDGDLDIALTNGAVGRERRDLAVRGATPWDEYAEVRQVLLNDGAGSFSEVVGALGDERAVGRGLVAVDLDGDGDLDVVTTQIAGPARVFENVAPRAGAWLRVRCVDPALSRDAYGARVTVAAGGRTFVRVVSPASSYASSADPSVHFGLGPVERVERVEVTWPGGERETFDVAGVGRAVVLERGSGTR